MPAGLTWHQNLFVGDVHAGLEPTNFYKVAVHPTDPKYVYAGAADIKGVVSEDGGESWRVIDPNHQVIRQHTEQKMSKCLMFRCV